MINRIWPVENKVYLNDKILPLFRLFPGYCNICGKLTVFKANTENLREDIFCLRCGSFNRQRQLASIILSICSPKTFLPSLANLRDFKIWNTESNGSLHKTLSCFLGKNSYISSEFISPELSSGEERDGILHVDIQKTHFKENSFDFVLSSDVLEHVPDYEKALAEIFRVLKPGGHHIFTVPFYSHRFTIENRVEVKDGKIGFLLEPQYHGDPMRSEGALVYNIFALELLSVMENLGFISSLLSVRSLLGGILGSNGIVILAKKPA